MTAGAATVNATSPASAGPRTSARAARRRRRARARRPRWRARDAGWRAQPRHPGQARHRQPRARAAVSTRPRRTMPAGCGATAGRGWSSTTWTGAAPVFVCFMGRDGRWCDHCAATLGGARSRRRGCARSGTRATSASRAEPRRARRRPSGRPAVRHSGSAKATTASPSVVPRYLWPPAAMTTYCRPSGRTR